MFETKVRTLNWDPENTNVQFVVLDRQVTRFLDTANAGGRSERIKPAL